jgi:thioester reductase-like protein/aryl carrier-like protein
MTMYAQEFEDLYADAEKMQISASGPSTDLKDVLGADNPEEVLKSLVRDSVTRATQWKEFTDDDNLYVLGLDSLQTLLLTRDLKRLLGINEIAPSTVYTNPSVTSLAKGILLLIQNNQISAADAEKLRLQSIDSLIQKHQVAIDGLAESLELGKSEKNGVKKTEGRTVLLTGSTGSLGSYMLDIILKAPNVSHIFCLNRSSDSVALQAERSKSRGLSTEFPSDKVSFLTTDIAKPNFGLETSIYTKLIGVATDIIHNAWPVNWSLPVSAFDDQLSGISNLAHFSSTALLSPSILFVSSVSSVLEYKGSGAGGIPEEIIKDSEAPLPMGYGESKYVAERLLDYAAEKMSIDAKVVRLGQLSGPVHGGAGWSKSEWIPSLVISSFHVSAVPDSLGPNQSLIDWIPVDVVAKVLVELTATGASSSAAENKAQVYHAINPHTVTWLEILPTIVKMLETFKSAPGSIKVVPLEAWLQIIRADVESATAGDMDAALKANPAVKLLNTFEKLAQEGKKPRLETVKTESVSTTLKEVDAIKPEWIEIWCKQWLGTDKTV